MAFEGPGLSDLIKKLRNAGHKPIVTEPRYPQFFDLLRQQAAPPDVFLVDCQKLPSHARESSDYILSLQAYRDRPFVLFNVKKEDEEKTRQKVPGAALLRDDRILPAVESALKGARVSADPSTL